MSRYLLHCVAAVVLGIGIVGSAWGQGLEDRIPKAKEKPVLRVMAPAVVEQCAPGTGKFVIFTRDSVGKEGEWDFIAGAWELVPSRPEMPITKRVEFGHSSWNADTLLGPRHGDAHPRFVRLQVNSGDRGYAVNLYDIDYRRWQVRCLWQGRRLSAFGVMGDDIFCESPGGWMTVNAKSGELSGDVSFKPDSVDGSYWLVRKLGETEADGCWSYDTRSREFIAHFGPVELPDVGVVRSCLAPDGKSRAWVLAQEPKNWLGGAVVGTLVLQRAGMAEDVSVPVMLQARRGSGIPVIPVGMELMFSADGAQAQFRSQQGEEEAEDRLWSIEVATGEARSEMVPHVEEQPLFMRTELSGVPVLPYLRAAVREYTHFGSGGLAPDFFQHVGVLEAEPQYPGCTAAASRDGRHVLYAAKQGPLKGTYFYGDLVTKQVLRWQAPEGLDPRAAQEFVWVETPE